MSLRARFLAMNGTVVSPSGDSLGPAEKASPDVGSCAVEEIKEKIIPDIRDYEQEAQSLGERVREEVRDRLGGLGDEMFDEDDSAEVQILDEEEIIRGTRGVGALWKLALGVTVSIASYVLFSGPRFEPKWIPNITERDPIPKIYRQRNWKK